MNLSVKNRGLRANRTCQSIDMFEILLLQMSKQGEAAPSLVNRVTEPEVARLNAFRSKAEAYMKHFMGPSKVDFEWLPMTFQEYVKQKKEDDCTMKMNLVHFIHSIRITSMQKRRLFIAMRKSLRRKELSFVSMK